MSAASGPTNADGRSHATLGQRAPASQPSSRPDNPYVASIKIHNDVAATILRENGFLRVLSLICLAVTLGALALAFAATHKAPWMGAIIIDRNSQTHTVTPIAAVNAPSIRQELVGYFLPKVIEGAFTVGDNDENRRDVLDWVVPFVANPSQADKVLQDYLVKYDPDTRGQTERVRIDVDKIPPPSRGPNEYVIGWTATTTSLSDGTTSGVHHYQAVVDLRWVEPFAKNETTGAGANPVGMQLISISVLSPNGAAAQSSDAVQSAPTATPDALSGAAAQPQQP